MKMKDNKERKFQIWNSRSKKYVINQRKKSGFGKMSSTPFEGVEFGEGTSGKEHLELMNESDNEEAKSISEKNLDNDPDSSKNSENEDEKEGSKPSFLFGLLGD